MLQLLKKIIQPFITKIPHKTIAYYSYHFRRTRYYYQHNRADFANIESYCMFLGYPRSSHTLIGAMLDAHPNMVVAHELNVLDMVKKKNSRDWIIASILAQSDWFVNKINAQWTGYSYLIPNQWQGKYKQLKVVGDKKGGVSSRLLTQNPQLIEQLQSVLQMNIKIIHVVRNPFDIITTMASWKGEKRIENITGEMLQEQTEQFFMRVEAVQQAKNNPKYPVFDLYNEQLTAQPAQTLSQLCTFLGVDAPEDYLKDCASIVFAKSKQSRQTAPWNEQLKQWVLNKTQKYDFLKHYTFD
jgi:hypothetical protein